MYSDKRKTRVGVVILAVVILAVILLVYAMAGDSGKDLGEESAAAIQEAVQRSALQCYVVEGVYPPNLEYLQDNYGLQVNTEDFYVTYEAFASNLPPTVRVVVRH